MKSKNSLPESILVTSTLAQRIQGLRSLNNFTVLDLAKLTKIPIKQIEDIESGLDTWLSSVLRQKLANALKVEPNLLLEVEFKDYVDIKFVDYKICPNCKIDLQLKTYEGFDFNNDVVQLQKFYCSKCPYVITKD